MISPDQSMLHLTSRGPNVRKLYTGQIGTFINTSKHAINNVNKFGLLHYSIPKMLDHLDGTNRTFNLTLNYKNKNVGDHTLTVTLPTLDYYSITVDSVDDNIPFNQANLCEILQTSINWALQRDGNGRLGCVVRRNADGRLAFFFGYRGSLHTVTNTEAALEGGPYHSFSSGDVVVASRSGCPYPNNLEEKYDEVFDSMAVASNMGDSRFNWIDTAGRAHSTAPTPNALSQKDFHEQFELVGATFSNLSPRLQMFLGVEGTRFGSTELAESTHMRRLEATEEDEPTRIVQRGRIVLVNYKNASYNNELSGIIELEMPLSPNLHPPSFLFLNLTTQGTKTRVLGHQNERGGWAVPCASSEFRSYYDNFPWAQSYAIDGNANYSIDQVRNTPYLQNLKSAKLANEAAKGFAGSPPMFFQYEIQDGSIVRTFCTFDPICQNPEGIARTVNENGNSYHVQCQNDFSLVVSPNNHADMGGGNFNYAQNYRYGSRFIIYGDPESMAAPASTPDSKAFGDLAKGLIQDPCFTVSMITPTWIYTEVPNSTVQTLDVQLMWGDTSQNVNDSCPIPCQFTMLASQ